MASNNISPQSSSKKRKTPVQPHFIVKLSFSRSDRRVKFEQIYGAKSSYNGSTQPFHRSSIEIMDAALCIVLLFAASVTGRPLGLEIAKVCIFAKKNFLLWAKEKKTETRRIKTDSTLRPHKPNLCPKTGRTADGERKTHQLLPRGPESSGAFVTPRPQILHLG